MNLFDLITLQQKNVLTTHMTNYINAHEEPSNWLTGWLKRRKITLTGHASGAQNDYQLKFTVPFDSDMQNSFDDIRFTAADGDTLINAWLEVKSDGVTADIWAKLPTTPYNTATQKYYMYYGRAGVANYWDGTATFLQYHGTTNSEFIDSLNVSSSPIVYEAKARRTSDPYNIRWGLANNLIYSVDDGIVITPTGGRSYMATSNEGVTSNTYETPGFTLNQWYKLLFTNDGSIFHSYVDGNEIAAGLTTNLPIDEYLGLIMEFYDGTGEQLWSFARKYVTSPPTYVFGNEESA